MSVSRTKVFFTKEQSQLVNDFAPWKQLSLDEQELYSSFIALTKDSLKKETTVSREINEDGSITLVYDTVEEYSHELFLETYYLFFGRELGDRFRKMFSDECNRLGVKYETIHADVAQW